LAFCLDEDDEDASPTTPEEENGDTVLDTTPTESLSLFPLLSPPPPPPPSVVDEAEGKGEDADADRDRNDVWPTSCVASTSAASLSSIAIKEAALAIEVSIEEEFIEGDSIEVSRDDF
jgi:hypothetical protein